ncbi:MAG: glycosyltransferase, partial [Sphingomonas bacterium]
MDAAAITVIILTYNEELHLARCLQGVASWCTRIIIVDSFSTDRTLDIARAAGAEV